MPDIDAVKNVAGQKESIEAAILQFTDHIKYKLDRKFNIPTEYNDNKIVLMVRDPWTIHSYWEINREKEKSVREKIQNTGLAALKSILRVYDVSSGQDGLDSKITTDYELKDWASSWYIHCKDDGKKWMADIGILCSGGEFFCLARSNVVATPHYGMSDVYDEEWMCPEELYYKMFAAAGGFGFGTSSMEMKEMITRYLKEWISSGGVSSNIFQSGSFFRSKR